uniref:Reverse transcriptase domain-containing protein n=1 Tax=Lactuca sativa TaxID=4236 RepID=A0A9R1VD36_LACSA|nr:hypothetical protein LSAT_V11C500292530 [Lactuca sativa]
MEIKYIGGLRVLILFDHSVAAKEFMENRCRWKDHMKWLRSGEKAETHAERVAWIRITGLPLHLWGQSNFELITSAYGKTIAPFKDIPHRIDLSHVKIGILTKRKTRINEEVTAKFEGKEYRLGIIEFDEDWFPFRFDPSEDYLEKTDTKKNDDDPEEDDVEMAVGENEREEGEIWPELQNSSEENRVPVDDQGETEMVDEEMHGEQTKILGTSKVTSEPTPQILEALLPNGNNQEHVTNVGIPLTLTDGAHNGLHPTNCFGPFPYQLKTDKVAQTFRTGGSNGKRRRLMKLNKDYNTPVIRLMESPTESDPAPIPQTVPLPDSPPGAWVRHRAKQPYPQRGHGRRRRKYPTSMNCLSLNVRGIGETHKVNWVKRLKVRNRSSFVGIQETQLRNIEAIDVHGCWDSDEFGFSATQASGRSGGILSLWDANVYNVTNTIKSKHFLITIGDWEGIPGDTIIANVYGPHELTEKRRVWEELLQIKRAKDGTWIVFGDFNTVRRREERHNSQFCPSSAFHFNRFINEAGLHDIQMGGNRFTLMCQSQMKLSKLDRFLVCNNFINLFPSSSATALPRELSDHCPIILQTTLPDFGKPPFRLFNSWLGKEGFDDIVKKAWEEFRGFGTPDMFLKAKLKFLKNEIKKWRATEYPKEMAELQEIKRRVQEIDLLAEERTLTEQEICEMRTNFQKIAEMEKAAVLDIKQRAKIKWLIDGDENSAFFHGLVNNKKRKNKIAGLLIDNNWIIEPEPIKEEIFNFYRQKFQEKWPSRPKFSSTQFSPLDIETSASLEAPFTLEEVKNAIWSCGNEKSPGPNGFSFKFIKRYWDTLKNDIMNAVKHFENHGNIGRGCNASFITLIPKIKDPLTISDYRPISLIGCMYKVIAKVMSIRLKKVIGECIGEVQAAFIEGRNILEGPLIINEMCSWVKKTKDKMLLFKVDFNKAFDTVNWEYLDHIQMQLGFGERWRGWIKTCLRSSTLSVLVNGSPTNDALFVGEWGEENIKNLARILRCFHVASGLRVNFKKSRVLGIGVEHQEVTSLAEPLGCEPSRLPFSYLGVPSKTLSFGGRLTLAKAVLGSLPTFYFSLFVAPAEAGKNKKEIYMGGGSIDRKKINWVSWEKVTAPREADGLGLGSLKALNLSLIVKWLWRLKTDGSSLWSKVIKGIHNLYNKPADHISKKTLPGVWNNIAGVRGELEKIGIDLNDVISKKIGSGDDTMFWLDRWTGGNTLKTSFPEMYKLERHKHCKISDRLYDGRCNWNWKEIPTTLEQVREFHMLINGVNMFQLVAQSDRWVCNLSSDGVFHVNTLRTQIDWRNMMPGEVSLKWTHEVPLKVNCFIWRAKLDRLPTARALTRRGIQLMSALCPYCELEEEDTAHALFRCPLASKVWEYVGHWCNIPHLQFQNAEEMVKYVTQWGTCSKQRKTLTSICYGTAWSIWKARCDWIFKKQRTSPPRLADSVKSIVFTWIKHRRDRCNISWIDWCVSPFTIM